MGRKRKQQPSLEERSPALEAQADRLLAEQDHDLLLRLVATAEAIREGMETIKLPSNDPEYLRRLQTSDAQRNAIANQVGALHVYSDPDKGETWIGVSVNNRRDQATAIETARQMGEHFEAKVIRYD